MAVLDAGLREAHMAVIGLDFTRLRPFPKKSDNDG